MGSGPPESRAVEFPVGTLVELFLEPVDRLPDHPALRSIVAPGSSLTYAEVFGEVQRVVASLRALGLARGDRAALLSPNRPEWALADYGCLAAGVVDVPIYSTLTGSQVAYILRDSGSRLLFLSDEEQLTKMLPQRGECPALEWIVVFDPPAVELPAGVLSWEGFLARGEESARAETLSDFRMAALRADPEEVATILYTSGTTGDPKGVMLTHRNLYSNVRAGSQIIPIDERDTTLSFLPLSHVFQRMVDYLLFNRGCTITYARSIETVAEDLRTVRPTIVVSVPRLYEKVYTRVAEATGARGVLVRWARRIGDRWATARLAGEEPDLPTRFLYPLARRLVFSKIYAGVGGRLRYFVSGGAPLSPEINRFFFSAGIMILEGYGLTETSPVTHVNGPKDFPANFRIGTVGKAVPWTEVQIAEDGEILIRGPQVMKGYFGQPEATREVLTEDGWFHTGDIGELDGDGFLRITDRKKDLIVTAGGKNVAPQPIENRLKKNRFIDQAVLLGDRRHFICALVVPDAANLFAWARSQGIPDSGLGELLREPRVQQHLESEVMRALEGLARYETPKKLLLLDREFTIEDGSLTPTQKVRRRVVEARYRESIEAMYDEANEGQTIFTLG